MFNDFQAEGPLPSAHQGTTWVIGGPGDLEWCSPPELGVINYSNDELGHDSYLESTTTIHYWTYTSLSSFKKWNIYSAGIMKTSVPIIFVDPWSDNPEVDYLSLEEKEQAENSSETSSGRKETGGLTFSLEKHCDISGLELVFPLNLTRICYVLTDALRPLGMGRRKILVAGCA